MTVTLNTFPWNDALLWVGGCVSGQAQIYWAKRAYSPHFLSLQMWMTYNRAQIFTVSISAFLFWCRRLWSLLFSRVMSVFVTLGGRASSANEKLMNVCRIPAKTTPPAPTFSTATSRCERRLEGAARVHIRHLINAGKAAICPSRGGRDNELQMAGEINESINGSQQEKVPGDVWLIGGKKACVYASANVSPSSLLTRETWKPLQVEKLGDKRRRRRMGW